MLRGGLALGQLTAALAALTTALAAPAWAQSEPPPPIELTAQLKPPLDATGQARAIKLGDTVELVVTVRAPKGSTVWVPRNPALGSWRLVAKEPIESQQDSAYRTEIHRYRLMAMRLGAEAIPAMGIDYKLPDGTAGSLQTPRLRQRVRGWLENESSPNLGAPPDPVPVVVTDRTLVWVVSVGGSALAAALITLIVLLALRNRLIAALPGPPPPPPNVLALAKLKELARADMEPDARYAAVVDVLREYLGGRYGFDGLETTTHELMAEIRDADLKEITLPEISSLMDEADLIKFARLKPRDSEARAQIQVVRRIVEVTWEEPEEEEELEEKPRLELATARERVKAGGVDAALAGAVSTLPLGAFVVAGLSEWAWIALVVFGLLMLFRDAFGKGSPGKAMYALRLARNDDEQDLPGVAERLKRNALLFIAPVGLPIELLVLLYHPLGQRVGDRWAATEVVRLPTLEHRRNGAAAKGVPA